MAAGQRADQPVHAFRCGVPLNRLAIVVLCALTVFAAPRSDAQELVSGLSHHLIEISANFQGTELLTFGAIEGTGDVVVVVRGPRKTTTVRKKGRVFGIWLNKESSRFLSVPGFYGLATTRPLEEIGSTEIFNALEIGVNGLRFEPEDRDQDDVEEFREALIQIRQEEGLFPVEPSVVEVVGGKLFKASIPLPAGIPVGTYTADTFLVREGVIAAAQSSPIIVSKAGFSAEIFHFAHRNSLLYGVLAVIGAVMAGLTGNFLFRRP